MTTPDGFFGKVASIGIGDEYDKRRGAVGKDRPAEKKNFVVNPGKRGNGPDSLFDRKILSLAEGDKYVDPGTRERAEAMERDKKKLSAQGFVYSSKNFSKSNPIAGMIGEYPKHEAEYVVVKPGETPAKAKPSLKNILTSPPKKGGAGFWGTTLNRDQFKYVSDPYDKPTVPRGKGDGDKGIGGAPFKTAVKGQGGFSVNPATGADKIYTLDVPLPAPSKKATDKKEEKKPPAPWKPSNPPKKGAATFISTKFEYQFDPIEQVQPRKKDDANKSQNVWKPVSGAKSTLSRSIAFVPTGTI